MGALETNTTLIYGVHLRESANDGSDFTNAAADYRIAFIGEDGEWHLKDSSGTVTSPGGGSAPTTNIIVDIATPIRSTAGNVTLNSTNWMELAAETGGPGTGTWDLDFTGCQAGDILEVYMSFFLQSAATYVLMDMQTIVSASPVNAIGAITGANTGEGVQAWYGITNREEPKGGSVMYAIQSGDLSAGALKVRPYFRTSSATNRTMLVGASNPLQLGGKVFRP